MTRPIKYKLWALPVLQHNPPILLTGDIDMNVVTRIVVFSVVLSAFSAKLLAENIQLHDMELTPADITFDGRMAPWPHWTKAQCSRLPIDNIRTRKASGRLAGFVEKEDKLVPYLTNKNPVNHPIIDYKDPEKIKIDPEKIFPPETLCMFIHETSLRDYWGVVADTTGKTIRVKGVRIRAWRKNKNEQCPGSIERDDDDFDGANMPCTRFLEQVGGVNAPGILKDYKIDHYATE